MARYKSDGQVEYLGRRDNQIKIRGFRVELGEIEAAVAEQPNVRECAVAAYDDGQGGLQLAAYIVWDASAPGNLRGLRDLLKKQLPDHMVPLFWVELDKLPLSAHGKINRKALPAPLTHAEPPRDEYVAPRTSMEQLLAGIWADVLRVPRIGIRDNFFELGGHSLLAMQAAGRLADVLRVDALHLEIPLQLFFQYPTIEEFAIQLGGDSAPYA
jgi:hypothetical protein